MTTYETLASLMQAKGIAKATPKTARELALRSMYGTPLSPLETEIVETWIALPWQPEIRNVKKGET